MLNDRRELTSEARGAKPLRLGDAISRCEISGVEALNSSAERAWVRPIEEEPGAPLDHRLQQPPGPQGDDRPPRRLRFDRGDPEFLGRRDY